MLNLKNVNKDYYVGVQTIHALKDISLSFREREFVAVLGPSGCGKTTLLNLIGGLDRYTTGDLEIDQVSTKSYKDADWDAYRNHRIGFVFQNYNLISHISVLQNVELALTISGVSSKERKQRAKDVLEQVGLADQLYKKPNQLSGGQMQRVAIARALVNDPNIILADEPTGALDSKTSLQIMEILKKISNDKLIIMVTHNPFLAKTYSDRTIHLLDGEVQSDSQPYVNGFEPNKKNQTPRTSMSFPTALRLSFNNLFTKKIRTIITSIAGSIGIIGVAMVLSLSNGLTKYVDTVQTDLLASLPILIERTTFIVPTSPPTLGGSQGTQDSEELFPDYEYITPYIPQSSFSSNTHVNVITQDYMDYLDTIDPGLYDDITYRYSISPIFLKLDSFDASYRVNTSSFRLGELAADNSEYLLSQYDLLAGEFPLEDTYDAVIVVNTRNQLPDSMLNTLGFAGQNVQVPFEDLIGMTFKLVTNDQYFIKNEIQNKYNTRSSAYFDEESLDMRVVGILRMKPDASANILSMGIGYTSAVTNYVLETSRESQVVEDQLASFLSGEISGIYYNVISGNTFTRNDILNSLTSLGAPQFPNRITIYPKSFESKDIITGYLRDFNSQFNPQTETSQMIIHTDISEAVSSVVGQMISTITIVLVAFAGISLFVSSIMIGIITYVSVIERTKEIGVLRSIGARKKDITRVFNAETMIIGFGAGVIGIALTMILNPIINMVFYSFTKARNLASLTFTIAFVLILVSVALTLIAGLIPAKIASKKDPVVALRTE